MISLAIGVGVTLAGGFEFRGSTLFEIQIPLSDPQGLSRYRQALINHAYQHAPQHDASKNIRWDVEIDPAVDILRLIVRSDSRTAGVNALGQMTDSYLEYLGTLAAQSARPDSSERILQERLTYLRSGLAGLNRAAQADEQFLGNSDIRDIRHHNQTQLAQQRDGLLEQQQVHHDIRSQLAILKTTPLPGEPTIDPDVLAQALKANVNLEQDLAELHVRLTEVRSVLLTVWQATAPVLDDLMASASNLQQVGDGPSAPMLNGDHAADVEQALEAGQDYQQRLRTFARKWTRDFVALRQINSIDPNSPRIIDAQQRLKDVLADFLYQSASVLTTLREQITLISDESTGQAQDHRVITWLTRGFHGLQSAHHRFEFAASDVQVSSNFRLAAALRSAQGLRQRTVIRRREINRRLTELARQQAVLDRRDRIADLESTLEQLADRSGEDLRTLLALQDQQDAMAHSIETDIVKRTQADAAGERINELNVELLDTQQRLEELADARPPTVDPNAVRLLSCTVDPIPVNLAPRLAYGWAAFATCMLTFMVFFSRAR